MGCSGLIQCLPVILARRFIDKVADATVKSLIGEMIMRLERLDKGACRQSETRNLALAGRVCREVPVHGWTCQSPARRRGERRLPDAASSCQSVWRLPLRCIICCSAVAWLMCLRRLLVSLRWSLTCDALLRGEVSTTASRPERVDRGVDLPTLEISEDSLAAFQLVPRSSTIGADCHSPGAAAVTNG